MTSSPTPPPSAASASSPSDARQILASLLADLATSQQGQNRAARSLHHERLMAAHLKAQAGRGGGAATPRGRGGSHGGPAQPVAESSGNPAGQPRAPTTNGWMSKILPGALTAPQPGPKPMHSQPAGSQPVPTAASGAAGPRQLSPRGPPGGAGEAGRVQGQPQGPAGNAGTASGVFGGLGGFANNLTRSFTERNQQQN